jgi:hypothetical protein
VAVASRASRSLFIQREGTEHERSPPICSNAWQDGEVGKVTRQGNPEDDANAARRNEVDPEPCTHSVAGLIPARDKSRVYIYRNFKLSTIRT